MVPGQVGHLKARPHTKNPRSRIAPESSSQNLDSSGAVLSPTPLSASLSWWPSCKMVYAVANPWHGSECMLAALPRQEQ